MPVIRPEITVNFAPGGFRTYVIRSDIIILDGLTFLVIHVERSDT